MAAALVSFFPHMHLRGHDMAMTATFPGGRQETLLSVPAYDFNWQRLTIVTATPDRNRVGGSSVPR